MDLVSFGIISLGSPVSCKQRERGEMRGMKARDTTGRIGVGMDLNNVTSHMFLGQSQPPK